MQDAPRHDRPQIKIFLSSPGDVNEERVLADRVMKRLAERYAPIAALTPIIWEHEPLLATSTFQDQIEKPSSTDIVVCILWSRLGTRLPAHIQRDDGSRYDSGTEFEFEDAWRAMQETGRPDLLVYRKMSEPLISLSDDKKVEERLRQKRALDGFIQKWFHDQDGSLLAAFHGFSSSAEFEEAFEIHLEKLILRRLDELGVEEGTLGEAGIAKPDAGPQWDGSPFRGLETFEFEHAPIFYGRTHAISGVLDALRRQAAAGQAFVLVLGRSGGGKSSLVRAGVMPLLVEPGVVEGVGLWRRAVFRPSQASSDLFEAFATALTGPDALPELLSDGSSCAELTEILRSNPQGAAPLLKGALSQAAQAAAYEAAEVTLAARNDLSDAEREALRKTIVSSPPQARLALLVDQLEELFTDTSIDEKTRNAFMEAIAALARSGRVFVVSTLRSDFYHRCMEIPALTELKGSDGQYDLQPPTPAEIGQIIRLPAHRAGLSFEEHPETGARLDDTLRDVAASEPDSLPLLEFTLDELYQARTAQGKLTWDAYDALGGVAGALGQRAEDAYLALDPQAQSALSQVMRQIVHVGLGQDQAATKRPARLDSFAEGTPARRLVSAFVNARLFVVGGSDEGDAVVTLTHEALLTSWPRLRQWLDDDREFLRIRARVGFAAERWSEADRDTQLLLPTGRPLDEAMQLASDAEIDLSETEQALIAQSKARATRGRRLKQAAVAALVVLSVAASGAAWYADGQRREAALSESKAVAAREDAEQSAADAVAARAIADVARNQAEENAIAAETSRAEAEAARETAERSEEAAQARLNELFLEQGRQALVEGRVEEATLILGAAYVGDTGERTGALFSTALDIAGIRGPSVLAHAGPITAITTGPGNLVATASDTGAVAVRDAATGNVIAQYSSPNNAFHTMTFAPDGTLLAVAGDDGSVLLWDFADGNVRHLKGHFQSVTRLVFSEDGAQLASLSHDKTTRLWSVRDAEHLSTLIAPASAPVAAAFLRGGAALMTIDTDGSIGVWDTATGREQSRYQAAEGPVLDAAVIEAKEIAVLVSGLGSVSGVSFDPDKDVLWTTPLRARGVTLGHQGARVLVRSKTNIAFLDSSSGDILAQTETGDTQVAAAALSADATLAAVVDSSGQLTLADGSSGRAIATLSGHDAGGATLAFGQDGRSLITGAVDGTVVFWRLDSLRPCSASGPDGRAVAFSPDGAFVSAGDGRGQITITRTEDCAVAHVLTADPAGDWVQDLIISPDGTKLAAAAGAHVSLFDAGSGALIWQHKVPEARFATSVAWSADGKGVIAGNRARKPGKNEGGWQLLALDDGAELINSGKPEVAVSDVIAENDGRYVMTRTRFGFDLWWYDSGERRHRMAYSKTRAAVLFPSGTRIGIGEKNGRVVIMRHTRSALLDFQAHATPVTALATNASGEVLASGALDGDVALWNPSNGSLIARLNGHGDTVASIAFVPESDFVLSAAVDGSVILWDGKAGAAVARYDGPAGPGISVTVDPNGSRFAVASARDAVRVWPLPQPSIQPEQVAAAISDVTPWGLSADDELPKGRWQSLALQALSDHQSGQVRDGRDGDESDATTMPMALASRQLLETGRLAGVRGDAIAAASAWNMIEGALPASLDFAAAANATLLRSLTQVLDGHKERVEDIAFTPDGRLLMSSDWAGRLILWDTGNWTKRLVRDGGYGAHFTFSPDGTKVLMTTDQTGLTLVQIDTAERVLNFPNANRGVWSPDGRQIAALPRIGAPQIHDAQSGQVIAQFPELDIQTSAYAITPDFSEIIAPSEDGLRVINAVSRETRQTLPAPGPGVTATQLQVSHGGDVLSVLWSDKSGGVYDVETGALRFALPQDVYEVRFAPDGRHLAVAVNGGDAVLLSQETGETIAAVPGGLPGPRTFLPGGALFATSHGDARGLLLHDRQTGETQARYLNHATNWTRIAASPDGRWRVTTSGDGKLRIWDASVPANPMAPSEQSLPALAEGTLAKHDSGLEVLRDQQKVMLTREANTSDADTTAGAPVALIGHRGEVRSAAFTRDGAYVVTGGGDGKVLVWSSEDGTLVSSISEACDTVGAVVPTPDNSAVLVHCNDGDLRVFDMTTGRQLLTLHLFDPEHHVMAFADDGNTLLLKGPEGVVGWKLQP